MFNFFIVQMFLFLKSKGFNLEDIKMKESYKIDKLIALLSLSYCWCLITGNMFKHKDSRYRKKLGYYSKSIFKIGLNRISITIIDKFLRPKEYLKLTSLFASVINGFK